MSRGDATDVCAPVDDRLLGPHEGVVDLDAVVVNQTDAGECIGVVGWGGADANHFAVDRDVFTYFYARSISARS